MDYNYVKKLKNQIKSTGEPSQEIIKGLILGVVDEVIWDSVPDIYPYIKISYSIYDEDLVNNLAKKVIKEWNKFAEALQSFDTDVLIDVGIMENSNDTSELICIYCGYKLCESINEALNLDEQKYSVDKIEKAFCDAYGLIRYNNGHETKITNLEHYFDFLKNFCDEDGFCKYITSDYVENRVYPFNSSN